QTDDAEDLTRQYVQRNAPQCLHLLGAAAVGLLYVFQAQHGNRCRRGVHGASVQQCVVPEQQKTPSHARRGTLTDVPPLISPETAAPGSGIRQELAPCARGPTNAGCRASSGQSLRLSG